MYNEVVAIAGLQTEVKGNTITEILEDIAAAHLFAERHGNNREEMAKNYEHFMPVYKAAMEINKLLGATVIKSPVSPKAEEVQNQIKEKLKKQEAEEKAKEEGGSAST